jgi:lysophospholipase L1-like esterase
MSRPVRRLLGLAALATAVLVPVGFGSDASPASAEAAERYVALGDSYASGTGTGTTADDAPCRRSASAYPALLAAERPAAESVFVACSGAATADVLAEQVAALTRSTTRVTISVGGNDVGFGDLISECIRRDCTAELAAARAAAASILEPRLDELYAAVRARVAPSARVVVVGYPRLFSGSFCFGTTGVLSAERTQANRLSDELDRVIRARAEAHGFRYVSTISAFTGHAICSGSAWVNGLNIVNPPESFHPTRSGHRAGYLPLVRAAFA